MPDSKTLADRRGFLVFGAAAAGAAVLAACGKKSTTTPTSASTSTTSLQSQRDVVLLRTASSMAELEVAVYKQAINGNVLKTFGDTAKDLLAELQAHAKLLEGETTKAGGQPFTQPNPVVQQQLQSRISGATDEGTFLRLAYDLALQTAATCMAGVNKVDDPNLNVVLMSIAGVQARHAALIGPKVGQPVAPNSFWSAAGAVTAGTGV